MTFLIECLIASTLFTLFVFQISRNPIKSIFIKAVHCNNEDKTIRQMCVETHELQQTELRLEAEGKHAVRHSEAFRFDRINQISLDSWNLICIGFMPLRQFV